MFLFVGRLVALGCWGSVGLCTLVLGGYKEGCLLGSGTAAWGVGELVGVVLVGNKETASVLLFFYDTNALESQFTIVFQGVVVLVNLAGDKVLGFVDRNALVGGNEVSQLVIVEVEVGVERDAHFLFS